MRVRVVFYGGLQSAAGDRETSVVLQGGRSTVRSVVDALERQHPELHERMAAVVYSVGTDIVDADHELSDGDEVGLLPPVSGG